MEFWTFVFLVTMASLAIPLSKLWLDHREKTMGLRSDGDALGEEFEALSERVAVLEEIVTDKSYQLRRELDSLDSGS